MTELDSPAMSKYLVGPELVGEERARSKESAIIIKSSLIEEQKGKVGSQRLSLMLKSLVIRTTLSQIRYLLVVILGLNSVSGIQYKGVMTDR